MEAGVRPTVLLDCDGVLADFVAAFLDIVEEETGERFLHSDVGGFDIKIALGLDAAEAVRCYSRITPGFCGSLAPIAGAIEGVASLQDVADVYIVTSPWNSCPTWMSERELWLKKHFAIHHSRVIHGSAKHLVRGNFLVDDKAETVIRWQAAHPDKSAVLWAQPWNEYEPWGGVRTNDWARLRALVEAVS